MCFPDTRCRSMTTIGVFRCFVVSNYQSNHLQWKLVLYIQPRPFDRTVVTSLIQVVPLYGPPTHDYFCVLWPAQIHRNITNQKSCPSESHQFRHSTHARLFDNRICIINHAPYMHDAPYVHHAPYMHHAPYVHHAPYMHLAPFTNHATCTIHISFTIYASCIVHHACIMHQTCIMIHAPYMHHAHFMNHATCTIHVSCTIYASCIMHHKCIRNHTCILYHAPYVHTSIHHVQYACLMLYRHIMHYTCIWYHAPYIYIMHYTCILIYEDWSSDWTCIFLYIDAYTDSLLTVCLISANPPRCSSEIICDTWTVGVKCQLRRKPRRKVRAFYSLLRSLPGTYSQCICVTLNFLGNILNSFEIKLKTHFFSWCPPPGLRLCNFCSSGAQTRLFYKLARANILYRIELKFELNWVELNWTESNWIEPNRI